MRSTRRLFLGMAAAGPALTGSPNDRIRIGLIGAGGRGGALMQEITRSGENAAITAICDVWRVNREAAAARAARQFQTNPKLTTDYRELLSWSDVDAVIISAPDFTHSQILEHAVQAGKDAYCEKPMGTRFDEALRAYRAVDTGKRVVQIGTQRRSDPDMIGAANAVRAGSIGKVTRVDMQVHFQEPRWRRDFEQIRAEDIDWPRFLLGRSERPFDARRFRQWQLFRDSTNGIPGLWMSHFIDLVPWFTGDLYPKSAVAGGGVFLWKDGRETEDVFQALLEYPSGLLVSFAMSLTNSAGGRHQWYGTRGTLDADRLRISGAGSKQADRIEGEIPTEKIQCESHMANFLRCVRSRKTPRADIQAGFSHAVAGCMAAEALRTGRRIGLDSQKLELV
ncbi:MAG: Gfo/Idh/MocA family oxidoreductase [Acidobacteria bacterium]|nr:Gfo/Idh/MocA family oxidoreductase [Acidobacteriota bacterium]MBI3278267.1 Gfo/Idh/MocA family oxidoreductase [Acidobacteriota bacterium]